MRRADLRRPAAAAERLPGSSPDVAAGDSSSPAGAGLRVRSADNIALKGAPESAGRDRAPSDARPQRQIKMAMEKNGATVQTCAIHLPGRVRIFRFFRTG